VVKAQREKGTRVYVAFDLMKRGGKRESRSRQDGGGIPPSLDDIRSCTEKRKKRREAQTGLFQKKRREEKEVYFRGEKKCPYLQREGGRFFPETIPRRGGVLRFKMDFNSQESG